MRGCCRRRLICTKRGTMSLPLSYLSSSSSSPDEFGRGYPRPQFRRDGWRSLNGLWDFALDATAAWASPAEVQWDREIRVPFAPEAPDERSGGDLVLSRRAGTAGSSPCHRSARASDGSFTSAPSTTSARSGSTAAPSGTTTAGTRRSPSISTPSAAGVSSVELVVRAEDDPQDLAKPRGKQDWQLEPHSIWYPRTSGIWQTVWTGSGRAELDRRGPVDAESRAMGDRAGGADRRRRGRTVCGCTCASSAGRRSLPTTRTRVMGGEVHRRIALSDPGIDDYRNELLWSPESPTLIEAELAALGRTRRARRPGRELHRAARDRHAG